MKYLILILLLVGCSKEPAYRCINGTLYQEVGDFYLITDDYTICKNKIDLEPKKCPEVETNSYYQLKDFTTTDGQKCVYRDGGIFKCSGGKK